MTSLTDLLDMPVHVAVYRERKTQLQQVDVSEQKSGPAPSVTGLI